MICYSVEIYWEGNVKNLTGLSECDKDSQCILKTHFSDANFIKEKSSF